jgi:WD40 repeat protein
VGDEDRLLTLWRPETGDCVAKLSHEWGLTAVAFAADSSTLITASADEVVSVWQRTAE